MGIGTQCYITCDECGKLLQENGRTVYGEDADCVRAEAVDMGWSSNTTSQDVEPDVCPDCLSIYFSAQ